MKHRGWITFSGFLWFAIGVSLLYKGLHFITQAAFDPHSLCTRLQTLFGTPQQAATGFIALGLMIGFFKGRYVLSKTVQRVVTRIVSLPLPIRFSDVYSASYWILIGSMIALGLSFKFLPLPIDIRGTVDLAIGSALINGSLLYFRAAKSLKISYS
ncbi:MAG TPA: hypothetical protein VLE89_03475 [Chlamydiales bacterium]|nr:hypothetical protein [Chlamydiales bacterium]